VLHQEIPDVPRSARESIHGHIKVAVRVTVDRSGTVVGETVEDPGSSRYFRPCGQRSGQKMKFAPADSQNPREWLLRFEFTRDGTTGAPALEPSDCYSNGGGGAYEYVVSMHGCYAGPSAALLPAPPPLTAATAPSLQALHHHPRLTGSRPSTVAVAAVDFAPAEQVSVNATMPLLATLTVLEPSSD